MTQEEIVKTVEIISSEINYGFSMPVHWKVQKEIAVYLTKSKIEMLERLMIDIDYLTDEITVAGYILEQETILKALEDGNN